MTPTPIFSEEVTCLVLFCAEKYYGMQPKRNPHLQQLHPSERKREQSIQWMNAPIYAKNAMVYAYLFTASANSAPALNLATFFAAILIFCFVAGLIPSRAGFSFTLKVPKPTN